MAWKLLVHLTDPAEHGLGRREEAGGSDPQDQRAVLPSVSLWSSQGDGNGVTIGNL